MTATFQWTKYFDITPIEKFNDLQHGHKGIRARRIHVELFSVLIERICWYRDIESVHRKVLQLYLYRYLPLPTVVRIIRRHGVKICISTYLTVYFLKRISLMVQIHHITFIQYLLNLWIRISYNISSLINHWYSVCCASVPINRFKGSLSVRPLSVSKCTRGLHSVASCLIACQNIGATKNLTYWKTWTHPTLGFRILNKKSFRRLCFTSFEHKTFN